MIGAFHRARVALLAFHRARVALLALALIACSTPQPEPKAHALFGGGGFMPSNTGGGSSGGLTGANLSSDGNDLLLTAQAAPATPAAGKLTVFNTDVAGRQMLATLGPANSIAELQSSFARKRTSAWVPATGSLTPATWGFEALRVTGTATARTPTSTTIATSITRLGAVSAAGAGSASGFRGAAGQLWLGNAAGLGGFYFVARFNVSDAALVATANMFVGIMSSTAVPTDVLPTTLTNLIGVGCNNGDTTLQLYASGAVAQARVNLGANFPVNTTNVDVYELVLYAAPNSSSVAYLVRRLGTSFSASGTLSGASIPTNTTFLAPNWYRSNGGTASAVGLDLVGAYAETDY